MRPIDPLLYKPGADLRVWRTSRFDEWDELAYETGRLWWRVTTNPDDYFELQAAERSDGVRVVLHPEVVRDSDYAAASRRIESRYGIKLTDVSDAAIMTEQNGTHTRLPSNVKTWPSILATVDARVPMRPPPLNDGQMWSVSTSNCVGMPSMLRFIGGIPRSFQIGDLPPRVQSPKVWEFRGETYTQDQMEGLLHQGATPDLKFVVSQLLLDPLNPKWVWST